MHITTRFLLLGLFFVLFGCGSRSLPATDSAPSSPAPLDGASPGPDGQAGCRTNVDCPRGTYCQISRGCAVTTDPGVCQPRPDSCPETVAPPPPVCGCDGKTHYSACEAQRLGVNVARQGACTNDPACEGISCDVVNSCCQCEAYDKARPPLFKACAVLCDAPRCESMGIGKPQAYCLAGMCWLTSASSCSVDADCALVNDCCACMALPVAQAKVVENQCAADCAWGSCGAKGIGSVKARCLGGTCRLAF